MPHEIARINFRAIPGLIYTSVLPRPPQESTYGFPKANPDAHSPFITRVLGKDRPIFYEYSKSKLGDQILWAYTDSSVDRQGKGDTAIGLYYDTDGILTRIMVKTGWKFNQNVASETHAKNELMLDINAANGYISGQDDEASWRATFGTGKNKLEFSATFDEDGKTIKSLDQADAHQMALLKRAGFHPKLFFAAEKIIDQTKKLPLKHAVYGTISELIGVLLLNTDIRIIESALAGAIDKPSPFLIWGLIAAGLLALNNVLVAMTNQLSSVSEEMRAALGSRDLRFILEALSHGMTAGVEDIGDNAGILLEELWRKRPINHQALDFSVFTPLGFKATIANTASHIG